MGRYWSGNPNRRQAPADYPIDDTRFRHFGRALQCGRRRHGHLRGALAAQHAVGLSRAHARRRGGRLAADLRGPRALLRTRRGGLRRVGTGGRSGVSARARVRRCRPRRSAPMGRRVARAHNQLGWHWWPGPNAIATRAYGPLKPCQQRATCMWGCVEGAKGSVDITHWPQLVKRGVQLVTGARVAPARNECRRTGHRRGIRRPQRSRAFSEGGRHHARGQRHRHAAAVAEFRLGDDFRMASRIPPGSSASGS